MDRYGVILCCVPEHSDVDVNEIVGELARQGFSMNIGGEDRSKRKTTYQSLLHH